MSTKTVLECDYCGKEKGCNDKTWIQIEPGMVVGGAVRVKAGSREISDSRFDFCDFVCMSNRILFGRKNAV
jgi:hypothetical protein